MDLRNAKDARQFPQWGEFLQRIGWKIEKIGKSQIAIRKIPLTSWSIIKVQRPLGTIDLSKLESIAKKEKAILIHVDPGFDCNTDEEFHVYGFRKTKMHVSPTATVKIDLTTPENELFASFSENTKRNIRKAQKNNVYVQTHQLLKNKNDDEVWNDFYGLLETLAKFRKFYLPSSEESYKKMLSFRGSSTLFFAYENGSDNPIAAVWLGYDEDVCFYIQTGINKRGYEVMANYLLVWEALRFAQKRKMKVFDFESIYDERYPREHKDIRGYTEFKKKFGGEIVLYPSSWIRTKPRILSYLL